MIQITADTRRAVVTNKELLTVGSAGIQVEFTLSEDWDGLSKLAVFRVGDEGTKVDVVLGESLTCVVPPEVLTEEGEVLFIGIYGANGSGSIIIPTVWASAGVVKPGTEPNTPASAEPTPVIWAQILGVAEDAEQTATEAMSIVGAGLQELSDLEGAVETAEAQRVLNEQGRVDAESQRALAENARVANENTWSNNETSRMTAESSRVAAENGRVSAETARVSAEASRVTAEEGRVAAEEYREEKYAEYVEAAGGYAEAAGASATAAAGSSTSAASSASAASTSAGQASSSASSASTSASQASSSASSASTSATTASNAATTATTKAGEAAASATAASGSATSAASAKTAAEAAQTAAETAAALMQPAATSADVGKALIAKTVSGGKVTEYEYGDVGGGDAGEITYDDSEAYLAGSLGAAVSDAKNAIGELNNALNKLQLQITTQIIPNKYIDNGAFVTYNTWSATDYIEVTDSVEEITITTERASVYNAWYDSTKTYMSEESLTLSRGTNVLTRPTGARYFALSNTTEAMSSTSVFFKVSVKNYVEDQIAESKNYTDSEVETVRETIPTSAQNQQYYNLLENHRDSLVVDQIVLDNGELWPNDNYISLSDYIECEPNTDYGFAFTDQINNNPVPYIAWYKSDKSHIETIYHANNTAYTSPSNAYFFRISCLKLKESQLSGHSDFSLAYFAKCDIPYGPPAIDMDYVFNDKYPNSSLRDKTWTAFGDSITEKNIRTTINYHDYIRAETGITVINKGVGGSGYKCRWQNGNNIPALADAFDFTGVDIVTCMAGINDAWTDLTDNMGNADDVYDTSATAQNQSVMACFNRFLDIVIAKAPFAKIGIISPIPCYHTQSGTLYDFNPANDNSTLAQFVEKCKASCKHHGIPYLDLFHSSGLRPWDSTVNDAMFKCNTSDSPDGLHPNHLGHKYFYPLVREFVKQLG